MTAHDYIYLGTLVATIWYLRRDVNGIGSKARHIEGKSERRWKHMIATQIETSATLDEAKQHAKLLREDAWRD